MWNDLMTEKYDMMLLTCDQKLTESQFSATQASIKKIMKKLGLKQNADGAESVKAVRLKSSGQSGG